MSEDFRPREHDHLVEPMFSGLGVEAGEPRMEARPSWLARCPGFLRRLFSRGSS